MGSGESELVGPDLAAGIDAAGIADGAMVLGHANGEPVVVARRGDALFAIAAKCTHYGGPLAEGLFVGETVRCPWHHACFDLRTGEALRAPALNPVACWKVERTGGRVRVTEKIERDPLAPAGDRRTSKGSGVPKRIVIVGAGAAGSAAAEMLRREGYAGEITMVDAEDASPYDRPNLSKDYLAGDAPEEWIPLRPPGFYEEHGISLMHGARAQRIDVAERRVMLDDGRSCAYDRLLLAPGATPVRLNTPGANEARVFYLRSLADSRALIEAAKGGGRAVVIGASFIGLEVAASLRARGVAVDVIAPESRPLERVLGAEVGDLIRSIHEAHGVRFHLGQTATAFARDRVTLQDGTTLPTDFIVIGVGVRPAIALAESAGLAVDRGVTVDEHLQTSVPGIFAAGDIARWPDPHTGDRIRVEHWVVAQRQGQCAARNMLGRNQRFDLVPFFWSMHYDVRIDYVGHAEQWDAVQIDGDLAARDAEVRYVRQGKTIAVATVGRDRASLEAEAEMEASVARA
jgi:apoptosis-inducing factor 3